MFPQKLAIIFAVSFFLYSNLHAQVGIGTTDPDTSAALEVSSTNSGFLLPRLTTGQRNSINSPAPGLMIYNLDENCLNIFNATAWTSLCGEEGVPAPFECGDPVNGFLTFTYNGESVTYGTVISSTGKCWLDRNLGASRVATSRDDSNAYGDLFQWGRLVDGHQIKTSGVTGTQSSTDIPGHSDFIASTSFNDWRNPPNNMLWQGTGGINNPCPTGFRLPTIAEWQTEKATWSSSNANGAYNSTLKLTLAGYRYNLTGEIREEGNEASYWSSTTAVQGGVQVSVKLYYENGFVNDNADDYRAFGASVRCIYDE